MKDVEISNQAETINSLLRNAATVARLWQLPDKDITIAGTDDVQVATNAAAVAQSDADAAQSNIDSHEALTNNPHSVTATQVGLGNANNTSDANKPVSTAQQTALNLKADITNWTTWVPVWTGFSTDPVGIARYCKIGKVTFFTLFVTTHGVSNANVLTFTLPVNSASTGGTQQFINCRVRDNGTTAGLPGMIIVDDDSNVARAFRSGTGQAWTASGEKSIFCTGFYESV